MLQTKNVIQRGRAQFCRPKITPRQLFIAVNGSREEGGEHFYVVLSSFKNRSHIKLQSYIWHRPSGSLQQQVQYPGVFKAIKAASCFHSSETPVKNSTVSRVLPLVIYVTFQSKDTSDISAFIHQSNMFISVFI